MITDSLEISSIARWPVVAQSADADEPDDEEETRDKDPLSWVKSSEDIVT